jgi:hypothetical protein
MSMTESFMPWWVAARHAYDRISAPIDVDGTTFYAVQDTVKRTGWSHATLRKFVRDTAGNNEVLTAPNGTRFVRKPRHRTDTRAPLYFDVDSVPKRSQTD